MDLKILFGVFVFAIVAISVVFTTVSDTVTTATAYSIAANDSTTFALNNTNYTLDYTPVSFTGLYYFPNVTFPIPTNQYVRDGANIKVLANNTDFAEGTYAYPNVTNGTTYYARYSYIGEGYVDNSAARSLMGFLPLLLAVAVVVLIIGYIGLK